MNIADKEFISSSMHSQECKSRQCMYPGCSKKAIYSHVFQQNGILKKMSVHGHLIIMEPPDVWKIDKLEVNKQIDDYIKTQ